VHREKKTFPIYILQNFVNQSNGISLKKNNYLTTQEYCMVEKNFRKLCVKEL